MTCVAGGGASASREASTANAPMATSPGRMENVKVNECLALRFMHFSYLVFFYNFVYKLLFHNKV